jgi:putative ABC transport system permease protein
MFKNQLLITLRNMMKNKLFLFINIFGMGISIACCIVSYFNYDFNASFDNHHENKAQIYRVNSIREFQGTLTKFGIVPLGLGPVVKENVPDASQVVRYSSGYGDLRIGQEVFGTQITYVDPAFFNLFTFEFVEGEGSGLSDKSKIYIDTELAKKYFGAESALGKSVTHLFDSGRVKEYVVAGVFKQQPSNSSFYGASAIAHFDNQFNANELFPSSRDKDFHENSWKYRGTLFIEVKNPTRLSAIASQLNPYAENNNKIREDFIIKNFDIEPFIGMAVRDSYNEVPATWTRSGSPIAAVVGIGAMGIFVLLIACFNLTNTAVAISSRRLKEIGLRKVMGGDRKSLIIQFIGETLIICFISLLLGVVIAEIALIPAFNELWPELKLTTDYFGRPNFLIFMVGTLLFTGILAGSYPAFYVSSFEPTEILKGKLKFGGTNNFTRTLLTLQFAISLIAIVCSLAFTDNAKFQRDFDIGFNKKGVVFTYINNRSEFETFRNRLEANPDVSSVAYSLHHFYSNAFNDPIKSGEKEIEVDILDVGEDYIKTLGLTLVDGRDFIKDSETDRKESVIITEHLASKFGWDKPIGKEITWLDTTKYYVIGVIKNVYNNGLWEEMDPVMIRYGKADQVRHIIASAPIDKIPDVRKDMERIYKELFPERIANIRYMDEDMVEANTVNNNIVKMFVFLGIVALMLSATGLFTLVSLNIIKKMKEIGVRKVLGASGANISKVINKEFVIILSISCVLGAAAGSWMAGMLMDSIWDYYQNATLVTMITSASILFFVSALSIGYKVFKTTRLNPSHVLRDE